MKQVWEQINKVIAGCIFVLLALILGFIYWVFPANTSVPLWSVCLVLIVCVFICIIEYALLATSKTSADKCELPKVKNLSVKDDTVIFIAEDASFFHLNSVVSIYIQNNDDVEELAGLAFIETKNEKGYLQIKLVKDLGKYVFEEYKNNSKKLDSIKIKNNIPLDFFNGGI